MPNDKLYLVDISSYVFRAYYGIRPLQTSKGIPTHATYGVITMLLKLIRDQKPNRLVIVFDSPVPSFRKKIYGDYKANRERPPEDLPAQFEHIKDFVSRYPLASIQEDGYEADDLIASLVRQNKGAEIVIVSADKDLMQLVGDKVCMYDSMRERWIQEPEVLERFGVGPNQVADVLALAGDASDNIPGVSGIGEKTAAKLVCEWGNLEAILDHAEEIKGKVGSSLRQDAANARLSKKLVLLKEDLSIQGIKDDHLLPPNQKVLNDLYRELELKSLIQESNPQSQISKRDYELILTMEDLEKWVTRLKGSKGFSLDTETTSVNTMQARLVGLSFSDGKASCYIPVSHVYQGCPSQLDWDEVSQKLKPILEDPALPKYGQNAKYDLEVLSRHGIQVQGLSADTLVASYLINSEGAHNLEYLAKHYLNEDCIAFKDIVPKGQTFDSVPLDVATRYAAEDADMTWRLVDILHSDLESAHLNECYREIEIPLIDVLVRMEMHGVLVDRAFLKGLSKEFGQRLERLEQEATAHATVEFNLNSPKQVADILFVKLGLPLQRKTKSGYSTDVDVLKVLAKLHPLPRLLLEHRMLSKLVSTYVDQLQELIHPETHRLHTSYHQTIAATGRLSSSDPNLQNIPIRSEDGRRIREAFIAPPGWVLLSADYSQIELRLLAEFSKDPNLIQAFGCGQDIHAMTAERIFGGVENRSKAKTINFGILYGQSAFGLAQLLGIGPAEAKEIIDRFYSEFPGVDQYKERVLEEARKTGEVRTWKGRRRLIPEIKSQNRNLRANAERVAFNTIFQGSAADLIKLAMIQIDGALRSYQTRMILQVHDELIFEVPKGEVEVVKGMIQEKMETAIPCGIPLKVSVGVGSNWSEAH